MSQNPQTASDTQPQTARGIPARAGVTLILIYAALFFSFSLWVVNDSGYMHLPPEVGDGHAFDNIAFNLARGKGFGHDWSATEWRAPYEQANTDGYYDWVLKHTAPYSPTAFRPPLYPSLLSVLYRIGGRKFHWWRYVNIGITVTAACLAVLLSYKLGGFLGATLTGGLAFFDTSFLFYVHRYMTEPLAALLVVALTMLLMGFTKGPTRSHCIGVGVTLGLMLLLRNIFILWLPFVALIIFLLNRRSASPLKLSALATYILAPFLLMILPWYGRNCMVTEAFMPFGTQGSAIIAVGYSDEMFRTGGKWTFKARNRLLSTFDAADQTGIEGEVAMAREGKAYALDWSANNITKIPELVALKISSLWWADTLAAQRVLTLIAFFGLLLCWGNNSFVIFALLLLANTFAIALTWNVPLGRFLIPLHPIFHILAAYGVTRLVSPFFALRNAKA